MRIKRQGLNSNETYCCTVRDIKKVFKNADIDVCFGFNIRRKEQDNRKFYVTDKNCTDKIIAKMTVCQNIENPEWRRAYVCSFIRFFIFEKSFYSEDAYIRFVQEVLPELYELYEQHKNDNPYNNFGAFSVTIGFDGKDFNFYEDKSYKWLDI